MNIASADFIIIGSAIFTFSTFVGVSVESLRRESLAVIQSAIRAGETLPHLEKRSCDLRLNTSCLGAEESPSDDRYRLHFPSVLGLADVGPDRWRAGGQKAFVVDGQVMGQAPALPQYEVEV